MIRLLTLPAGFLLDLLIGDPRWLYHPVCAIGKLISILEKGIRKIFPKTPAGERVRRNFGSLFCMYPYFFDSFWSNLFSLQMEFCSRISSGNVLVRTASCYQVFEG